jgi:septum formation protein
MSKKPKIILGSQSQNRKKMMEEMGLDFEIMTADIDEKAIRHADPKKLVLELAKAKAAAIINRINEPAILITSDQVVTWNGKIREKPENEKEAREFLQSYNTAPAETITSVVVTKLPEGQQLGKVDVAKVYFDFFTEDEIKEIIKTGQTFSLAGGFTVYGENWEKHIKRIEGTRDSVIGLPKKITLELINKIARK